MIINENTITDTLPPSIDKFLMDMSQMYIDDLSYNDISKFGDRATEEDIKQLRKYRRELSQGFEEDDPEIQEIFKAIKNIVKGNLKEDTNISIDNMEVNIDKVKNKSVRVDEDHQLEEIPPHDRDQLLIELKDVTNNFTIPSDTIVVGYESEKDYAIDILSENGYECKNSMKGEWFEISFNKKNENNLNERIKDAMFEIAHLEKNEESLDFLNSKYPDKSLKEDNSLIKEEKYNIGSNKLNITEEEKQRLEDLASKLMANSPNDYKYQVEETYEDYGSGMKWFTIICYNRSGDSWQVLNTKEWLDLMNTGDIDSVYQSVVNDKYFQDKQKELHEMNLGELFNYIKD